MTAFEQEGDTIMSTENNTHIANDKRWTVCAGTFASEQSAVNRAAALARSGFHAEIQDDRYNPEMEITAALMIIANTMHELTVRVKDISEKLDAIQQKAPTEEAEPAEEKTPKNTLGSLLLQKRLEKGITGVELARRIGVAKSTVGMWERGVNVPRKPTLRVLCQELEIEEDELKNYV